MASVQSNKYDGRYLLLEVWEKSYSVENNTSLIGWKLISTGGNSSYYSIEPTTVKVNGIQVYYKGYTGVVHLYIPRSKRFCRG